MEQGIRRTTYSIFPYTTASDANRRAALLNSPARVINVSFHHGDLPESFCGFSGGADDLCVSAIKKSEDGEQIIVRAYESDGKSVECETDILGSRIDIAASPYAIVTYNESGEKLNFIEWKI
jgi:alpha-mannosidase